MASRTLEVSLPNDRTQLCGLFEVVLIKAGVVSFLGTIF